MSGKRGKLVVLSGPSGAGKTSIVHAIRQDPRVMFSVSATTRPMRGGEQNGVDYEFLSREEFEARRDRGEFLEWAEYNGQLYGTLRAPLEAALAKGRIFVLEIEVDGTQQLRDQNVEGQFVFIVPPGIDALRERLEARGQNTAEDIERRLAIARKEMEAARLYDHVVENEVLEETVAEVKRLIGL
jgi:guanylate kinase